MKAVLDDADGLPASFSSTRRIRGFCRPSASRLPKPARPAAAHPHGFRAVGRGRRASVVRTSNNGHAGNAARRNRPACDRHQARPTLEWTTLKPRDNPARHEIVTHVSGTIRYRCVRAGHGLTGGESGSQSPLMYNVFFAPAHGHLRFSLPVIGFIRASPRPQASAQDGAERSEKE